ncbi:hypothetical protein GCK32_006989 [Trichostrongylus colubriformis]|uniref:DUF19 domain-containing protein n=1 Tax=Trichostrongylus colubriformis TaxID=6319 RepID=A0AAN8IQ02_TRICO
MYSCPKTDLRCETFVKIPFYSKKAIHRLCVSYISATDNCSEELFTNRCAPNPLMLFVDSHLKFFCGEYGPAYLGFTALSLASNLDFFRRLQKRLPHQYERSYFDATREQCKGMTEFFECIQGDLTDQCGQTATVLLEKSIEGLGCLNDYFKGAQKMELEVDLTALEPVRDNDGTSKDYPKMPEIAFDKDVSNDSIVTKKEETFDVSTATDLIADDTTESSSSQSEHRLLPRKVEVVTELSVEAVADSSSVAYNASSIVFGDDDSVSTTQEPELETTEFIITTTTHPPYCIPYRDHPTISRCHKGIMAKLSAITDESPESASVRFPLYNVSIDTLVELCDDFRDAKKCMEGVENYCRHPVRFQKKI